jgi:hypothetical protein
MSENTRVVEYRVVLEHQTILVKVIGDRVRKL